MSSKVELPTNFDEAWKAVIKIADKGDSSLPCPPMLEFMGHRFHYQPTNLNFVGEYVLEGTHPVYGYFFEEIIGFEARWRTQPLDENPQEGLLLGTVKSVRHGMDPDSGKARSYLTFETPDGKTTEEASFLNLHIMETDFENRVIHISPDKGIFDVFSARPDKPSSETWHYPHHRPAHLLRELKNRRNIRFQPNLAEITRYGTIPGVNKHWLFVFDPDVLLADYDEDKIVADVKEAMLLDEFGETPHTIYRLLAGVEKWPNNNNLKTLKDNIIGKLYGGKVVELIIYPKFEKATD